MSEQADHWASVPDPRDVAIDGALHDIEAELGHHLGPVERVAVTRALERLGEAWAWHGRKLEPWG